MPVDVTGSLSLAPTHPQDAGIDMLCVDFIFVVGGMGKDQVTGKSLGPMALFAGLARRTQVFYRSGNGALVAIGENRPDLRKTADLGAYQVTTTVADVTL